MALAIAGLNLLDQPWDKSELSQDIIRWTIQPFDIGRTWSEKIRSPHALSFLKDDLPEHFCADRSRPKGSGPKMINRAHDQVTSVELSAVL